MNGDGKRHAYVRNKETGFVTFTENALKVTAAVLGLIALAAASVAGLVGTVFGKASDDELFSVATQAARQVYEEMENTYTKDEMEVELLRREKESSTADKLSAHNSVINVLVEDVRDVKTDVAQLKLSMSKLAVVQDKILDSVNGQDTDTNEGGGD